MRLGRCSLACEWCDTKYTWDWDQYDPQEELHTEEVTSVLGRAVFKFVAQAPSDLVEVDSMVDECGLDPVYVMPEGTDAETLMARMRELAEPVLARGWVLTPRLHILLWGDERGR